MSLDEETALRGFARMMNTLDAKHLIALLSEDFHYASQQVWEEITSKQEYVDYIEVKLVTIAKSDASVTAEMANVLAFGSRRPCVIVRQLYEDEEISGIVLAEVKDDELRRLDFCDIPSVDQADSTGEFPR